MLWVGLGGGLGSVLRYGLGRWISARVGTGFPWGTLAVNLLGCLAIGFLCRLLENRGSSESLRLFLVIGLLGGFTTFSAFGLETTALIHSGRPAAAMAYVAVSVLGGVGATLVVALISKNM